MSTRHAIASLGSVLAIVAVVAGSVAQPGSSETPSHAEALARSAPLDFFAQGPTWTGDDLLRRSEQLGQRVPLPHGGNFNGIRWEEAGAATDADIAFVQQYNAACQWLRAADEGREAERLAVMWQEIPAWPAMRLGGNAEAFLSALAEQRGGGESGEPALLQACRESHERETAYAISLNRLPSR
jgi:hypothetical protein